MIALRHVAIECRGSDLWLAGADADGELQAFMILPASDDDPTGSIVRGRVRRVVPALEAAFVDIGHDRDGFLKRARGAGPDLTEGAAVDVLVRRPARGDKGAVLTRALALSGRYVVFQPGGEGVRVSRRIADQGRAGRLARLPDATRGGWIVRTAAEPAPDDAIAAEAEQLAGAWQQAIDGARDRGPPCPLIAAPPALVAALRDLEPVPARIDVRAAPAANRALGHVRRWWPDLEAVLSLDGGAGPGPIAAAGLDEPIAAAMAPRYELPGGGAVVVERTQALTAIDVDTGAATERHGRDAIRATNLEAAVAIARLLRLRNIAGLVVVDFVSMREPDDRRAVLDRLHAALADDDAEVHVTGLSALGLVELSRAPSGPARIDAARLASAGAEGQIGTGS